MVKLRMTRLGKKKRPFYRIIAIDSRKRRDGDFIERLGFFDPLASGKAVRLEIDAEKAIKWLLDGAQVSPTVKNIFSDEGIMLRYDMIRRLKKEKVESTGKDGKKVIKYIAVKDENGNCVRKYTDEQVEEAYKNFLALREKKKNKKPVEKKVLSKKAKAKIEAEKKAAADAAEAAKKAAEAPAAQVPETPAS
ncbi:MAG TPA: 30S ribosomal protein S16 [Clostridiales bacterium]|nr:30S ribosomal protein S16 [Clostridiales bacterium]HQP70063.1 30S ribosomal protein S16 [Clostridiales bacterium]